MGDEINIFDQIDGRMLDNQIIDRITKSGLVLNGCFHIIDLIDVREIVKRGKTLPQNKKRKC